jgi:hypothetical protein
MNAVSSGTMMAIITSGFDANLALTAITIATNPIVKAQPCQVIGKPAP